MSNANKTTSLQKIGKAVAETCEEKILVIYCVAVVLAKEYQQNLYMTYIDCELGSSILIVKNRR